MNQSDSVETFTKNLKYMEVTVIRVKSEDELNDALGDLLHECTPVFCQNLTELEQTVNIPEIARTTDYAAAAVTVEEVPAAIAETGSIVSLSASDRMVQANLLPPRHVALVKRENIFPDLNSFFSSFAGILPVNITLITGPSRTADIEQILITGVHGPERLDVIIMG